MSCGKKHFIYFALAFSFVLPASAQDTGSIIALADALSSAGRYDHAIKEYKRALFFDPANQGAYVSSKLADAFFALQEYNMAAEYYDLAWRMQPVDSLKYEFQFRKILCQILQDDYQFALVELFGMPDSIYGRQERQKDFYMGICFYRMGEYESAARAFDDAIQDAPVVLRDSMHTLLYGKNKFNRPSPSTAYILSFFLPGAGQFYAGDLRNGINSLVLNGAIAWLGIVTIRNYSMLDAFFTVLPWLQRYYQGGFIRAREIAVHRRENNRNELLQNIFDLYEPGR